MAKYIDKIEFHELLKKYKETKSPQLYEQIGKNFLKIARNYLNKPFFINYTDDWKDDMVSEAVYDMVRYIDNYDIDEMEQLLENGEVPDPFGYFSNYVYSGIMRYLAEKKKDKNVLVKFSFIENVDRRDFNE